MKLRYLVILSLGLALIGWRQLQINATEVRRQVEIIQAKDAASDDVTTELLALSHFSAGHMNASARFELTAGYQRALERAQAAAHPDMNDAIYHEAAKACGGRATSVAQAECTRQFVSSRLAPVPTSNIKLPDKKAFQYTFESPRWAPDVGGILLLVAGVGLLASLWAGLQRLKIARSPRT